MEPKTKWYGVAGCRGSKVRISISTPLDLDHFS